MLRGALLGSGNIAQQGHLPAYQISPEVMCRCAIVAAADLCDENLQQVRKLAPNITTFRQANELLDAIRPDFVDICAPPGAHRELIELAVRYGCHILCEKPLGTTLDDAEAIGRCVRETSLVFMPGHQYHYAPAWQAVSAAIRRGDIGTPRFAGVSIQRQRANDGNPFWRPMWRTHEALSGGGILMDHGTHLLYQLQSLFGEPRRVAACIGTRRHVGYDVEDTASCYIEYDQTLVRMNLTWAAARRRVVHRYFGPLGQILCDDEHVSILTAAGSRSQSFGQGFSSNSSHSSWYTPLLLDFLDRIERSDYERAPLDEAIATIRCATAAYDAARTGQLVQL